mmetsp:Transcript_129268/g.402046  ORF Transcript_129268/g.402046 Transcript_129268/m.402046 type:complete len:216 (+) Transcript_129268:843-1490(+)
MHRGSPAGILPVHHDAHCSADAGHHERRQGQVREDDGHLGDRPEGRRQEPRGQAAHEAHHADLDQRSRHAIVHDCHKAALPQGSAEVPRGELVRGPHGRRRGECHPVVRSLRACHDVRLQDGAHKRQGPLLRLWPCLQWHHCHGAACADSGPPLQGGRQGGPEREEHPAHGADDGQVHRADCGRAMRQHRRPRWCRSVHPEVGHHYHARGCAQHC